MKWIQFFLFISQRQKSGSQVFYPATSFPDSNSPNVTGRTYLWWFENADPGAGFFHLKSLHFLYTVLFRRSSHKVRKKQPGPKMFPPFLMVMTSCISFWKRGGWKVSTWKNMFFCLSGVMLCSSFCWSSSHADLIKSTEKHMKRLVTLTLTQEYMKFSDAQ